MRATVIPDLPPSAAPAQTRRRVSPTIRAMVFIVFILLLPPEILDFDFQKYDVMKMHLQINFTKTFLLKATNFLKKE
jgi:hypothetical protein